MKHLEYVYSILMGSSVAGAIYSFPNIWLSAFFTTLWFIFMELTTREMKKQYGEKSE